MVVVSNMVFEYNFNIWHVRDEWQYLVDRFSLNDRSFGRLIPSVCSEFNTQKHLEEVGENKII